MFMVFFDRRSDISRRRRMCRLQEVVYCTVATAVAVVAAAIEVVLGGAVVVVGADRQVQSCKRGLG